LRLDRGALNQELIHNALVRWCLGLTLLFPWVFIFALPPLRIGVWTDTEGVALAIASLGVVAAVILICLNLYSTPLNNLKKVLKFESFQHNPILLGVMGLALLSIITLPFSYDYQLSWFGHPEQMIGGWLWLSLSMILLLFLWLRQNDPHKGHIQAIRISTELACFAHIGLVVFAHPTYANTTGDWSLYHFTAHLGWVGAVLFLLSLSHQKRASIILKLAAIIAILLSQNKIAIGALILGPLAYILISKILHPEQKWLSLLTVLLAAPFCLLLVEYIAFSWDVLPSLSSRFISVKVLWQDFIQAPVTNLFTGMGWGQMSDGIIRQLPALKAASAQEAAWEGIGRYDASSLNQTSDAFASLGVLGAIFCFLIPLSPFLMTKSYFSPKKSTSEQEVQKGFLFTACLIVMLLHHGWFMMLSVFPLFISAVMTMDIPKPITVKLKEEPLTPASPRFRFSYLATTVSAALVLLWTSHSMYSNAIYYSNDLRSSLPVRLAWKLNANFDLNCKNLVAHRGPGSIPFAFWLRSYLQTQNDPIWDHKIMSNEIKCALKTIREQSPQPSLTLISQVSDYNKKKKLT
jgi:hypothetical protein